MRRWVGLPRLTDVGSRAAELRAGLRARTVEAVSRPAVLRQFPADDLPRRLAAAATLASAVPLGKSALSRIISALIDTHGLAPVQAAATAAFDVLPRGWAGAISRRALFRASLDALANASVERAIELGEATIDRAASRKTATMLARQHVKAGGIARPLALLEAHGSARTALAVRLREERRLLTGGVADTGPASASPAVEPATDRRVLYFVSQCRPHHSSGYAIRTHYLLRSLRDAGWDAACFARFGYPNDRWDFRLQPMAANSATIDGVDYAFSPDTDGFRTLSTEAYQRAAVDVLMEQVRAFRPAIVHAASNHLVGQAGTEAARRLGLPSIYEVRGMWHMTRASKQPEYEDSEHYRMTTRLEVQAAARADHVLAITGAVRDVLVAEGVSADRITLLPNAVDADAFTPRPRDAALADELGLGDEVVVGFIGSFAPYEGLDDLLDAAAQLRGATRAPFRILLVGDGAAGRALRAKAAALGLDDVVTFTGRVPHDDVLRYYSLIDVAVYPRKGLRVCEVVSPLKPLEAMAMARAVIVSSVAAQAEMVAHGSTGLVHDKDDTDSLAAALRDLIDAPARRAELGTAARTWVREHRSWTAMAATVTRVYRELLGPR